MGMLLDDSFLGAFANADFADKEQFLFVMKDKAFRADQVSVDKYALTADAVHVASGTAITIATATPSNMQVWFISSLLNALCPLRSSKHGRSAMTRAQRKGIATRSESNSVRTWDRSASFCRRISYTSIIGVSRGIILSFCKEVRGLVAI